VSGSKAGFRLDFDSRLPPNEQGLVRNLDPGQSHSFTIIPQLETSVRVLVTRGGVGDEKVASAPAAAKAGAAVDGWAEE